MPPPSPNELTTTSGPRATAFSRARLNDVGEVRLRTARSVVYDGYSTNRLTGSFILIEQGTNQTVAAGMLLAATEPFAPDYDDFAI